MNWAVHLRPWLGSASGPGCWSCATPTPSSAAPTGPSSTGCWRATPVRAMAQRSLLILYVPDRLHGCFGWECGFMCSLLSAPCPWFSSTGVWPGRVFKIPGGSYWTGLCVSNHSYPTLTSYSLMDYQSSQITVHYILHVVLVFVSVWSPLPAAALWTWTTSLLHGTWATAQSPPPVTPRPRAVPSWHQGPTSSGASCPSTSWSWRASRTTTMRWKVCPERNSVWALLWRCRGGQRS